MIWKFVFRIMLAVFGLFILIVVELSAFGVWVDFLVGFVFQGFDDSLFGLDLFVLVCRC